MAALPSLLAGHVSPSVRRRSQPLDSGAEGKVAPLRSSRMQVCDEHPRSLPVRYREWKALGREVGFLCREARLAGNADRLAAYVEVLRLMSELEAKCSDKRDAEGSDA
jgi:hypothetical protein